MIKLKDLYERFEFEKGDQYQVQGKTNSMQEFVKHIKNLPEELGSIKVTNSTLSFTDSSHDVEFKKKFTSSDKAKVIKIIRDLSIEFKKKKDPVYEYELRSFYGTLGKRTPAENNYYITMRTKAKDDFGAAMSRGDHGPLDQEIIMIKLKDIINENKAPLNEAQQPFPNNPEAQEMAANAIGSKIDDIHKMVNNLQYAKSYDEVEESLMFFMKFLLITADFQARTEAVAKKKLKVLKEIRQEVMQQNLQQMNFK